MKENQLSADGKLSPGDYDLLTKMARDIYTHPGLSPADRSKIAVKISGYEKNKSVDSLKKQNDLTSLNNEVTDDFSKNVMLFGNNPTALLQANADTLRLKVDQLASSVDSLNQSGDDSSAHENEYVKTIQQYNDTLDALQTAKTYTGGAPKSDFAAYITTNSKGEISDVKVGRIGSQSGYAETNGVYGGLPIYGKINSKEGGKNIFKLGNNTFSAADYTIPDPQNPGATKANPLVADDMKTGSGFQGAQAGQFKVIDPASLRTQTSLSPGEWAQGQSGFLYKRNDDGKYTKYANMDKSKLGISDSQVIKVPKSFESSIISPNVSQTVDGAAPAALPPPVTGVTPQTGPSLPPSGPAQVPAATSRTNAPVERSPQDASGVADQTQKSAGGFFQRLFGSIFGK